MKHYLDRSAYETARCAEQLVNRQRSTTPLAPARARPSLQLADTSFTIPQDSDDPGQALLLVDNFKPFLVGSHARHRTQLRGISF